MINIDTKTLMLVVKMKDEFEESIQSGKTSGIYYLWNDLSKFYKADVFDSLDPNVRATLDNVVDLLFEYTILGELSSDNKSFIEQWKSSDIQFKSNDEISQLISIVKLFPVNEDYEKHIYKTLSIVFDSLIKMIVDVVPRG